MVRLVGVARRFGSVDACADVGFALERGAFLTILGPSGSGKTTVLRMIAGFIAPTAGEIWLHGRPVAADPPYRRAVGMVFQKLALFPHLTAAGNVGYPLRMRGVDRREIERRVAHYLELVRLGGLGERRIHELSGGQQQRVAIARALVFEPDLLLLDEPLAALDKKLREEMQLEFRRLQRELGVTTINVTHDQREALVMSDRVIVMNQGRVQQDAAPAELYDRPANRFVAEFIGVTNLLAGTVREAGGAAAIEVGGTVLPGRARAGLRPGQPAQAAVRAERVRLGDPAGLAGTVREAIFEGDRTVYEIVVPALGGAALRAFEPHAARTAPRERGSAVTLGLAADDVWIFPDEPTQRGGPSR
ncbi:MAG: ABC transporter ATP-binding protein [Geminicoccaceae bacterium]